MHIIYCSFDGGVLCRYLLDGAQRKAKGSILPVLRKEKEADNFEKTGSPVDLFMGISIDRIWTVLLAAAS